VEDLTKAGLEAGMLRKIDNRFEPKGPLRALAIPSTLQDPLMRALSHTDRLAAAHDRRQQRVASRC